VIVEPREAPTAELIVVCGLQFASRCAAHGLPFFGVVHAGYVPATRRLDLADLAEEIERRARPAQRQERLTTAVSHWMMDALEPFGVALVVEAEHACHGRASADGRETRVVTACFRGVMQDDMPLRAEFLSRVRR
jgi:GTP cyclohydrolase I